MFIFIQSNLIRFVYQISMATLTGVLLDVSRSMKINAGGKINEKGGE